MAEWDKVLNTELALNRVCNDEDLYHMLLERFYDKYKDAGSETEKLLQEDRAEEALVMVHSIKGLLGNVGAEDVAEMAKRLEFKLRENSSGPDCSEELAGFQAGMMEVARAIEDYRRAKNLI